MRITIELPDTTKGIFLNWVWYDEKTDTLQMSGHGITAGDVKAAEGKTFTFRCVPKEDMNHETPDK